MKRSLYDIDATKTSHDVGEKRVLLAANESGCSLTQIAVTTLRAGDVAVAHIHPDMQEGFYVMEGRLEVTLDNTVSVCEKDDFVYVKCGTSHELRALTDVRIMTVGCVVEAMREKLYPMLFEPNIHPVVWGGQRLMEWKELGDESLRKQPIGESWEISAVESSPSCVSNGTWAGYSLIDVIAHQPREILGKSVADQYDNKLPLLAKFIDANKDLSIQVHPDNEMAWRKHRKMGKSEVWYVIDAKPGACLYAGFKKRISKEEFKHHIANGTITDVLARHEVHAGDVFYLPAGRVHAICSGILLAEIQQSSDVTYRIFDYNRPGMDGKMRELHTDLAAEALNYDVQDEYRTEYASLSGEETNRGVLRVLDTPFFSVRIVEQEQPKHRNMVKYDSFVLLMCSKGQCQIRIRATKAEVLLHEGYSCLVPAVIADYDIIPNGKVVLVEAYIDNKKRTLLNKLITGFKHYKG